MSRHFTKAAHDFVTFGPGAIPAGGPLTVIIVFRLDSAGTHDLLMTQNAGASTVWALNWSGGQCFATFGGGFRSGQTGMTTDTWYMYAFTKGAGTATVRDHLCTMTSAGAGDTWTHADMVGTIADGTGPIDHMWLGRAFGDWLGGYVAATATFGSVLNDAAVEALRPSLSAWVSAGAVSLHVGNDTPMDDHTVGNADQTAVSGTTVDTGTEPPAFGGIETTGTAAAALGGLTVTGTGVIGLTGTGRVNLGGLTMTGRRASGSGGSWYGLLSILQEARDLARADASTAPVACPNDGEPLRAGPHGELYCPFDGYRPDSW